MRDVLVNGRHQLRHAGKHAPTQSIGRDVAKEPLDHVQPRGRGRREVHVKSRVFCQPRLHLGVLVRGVVVGDQMQRLVLWGLAINLAQELQPLHVGVTLLALANDLAVKDVECGKQRGGAIALVVVCHGLRTPLFQRQPRLGAVQRLHLALLVTAQHQRTLGRRDVQAHDVFELFSELRIARDLEAAHKVRLEAMRVPMAHDGAGTDAQNFAHLARAPVRGRLGRGLRGQIHQLGHVHLHRRRTARQIALNAWQSRLQIPLAPARGLHPPDAQLLGDVLVLPALRRQQHDLRALGQSDAGTFGACESAQFALLFVRQRNRRGNSHCFAPIHAVVEHWSKDTHLCSINNRTLQ